MKFLACVDLRDDEVRGVVKESVYWARRMGATIDLLFVDRHGPNTPWVTDPVLEDRLSSEWDRVRREEVEKLDSLLESMPPPCRGRASVAVGRPADEILATRGDYDLIVVGGRPHNALETILVGSVASRVARLAPVSVLITRPRAEADSGGAPRILLGVDLKEDSAPVIASALEWAEPLGAPVDAAYADGLAGSLPYVRNADVRAQITKEWASYRDNDLRVLENLMCAIPVSLRGDARVEEGRPGQVLVELADGYDIVVVATHGRTGLDRLLLGSVAEYVVQHCPRSVLVLRKRS